VNFSYEEEALRTDIRSRCVDSHPLCSASSLWGLDAMWMLSS